MPLTTLPPELLSTILTHLSLKDTLSLLLTCKSLYPPSHRHLYAVLHLCDRVPKRYIGPPCPPFIHDPDRAVGNDGCRRLAEIINSFAKRGEHMPGFGYIRGLVLEPEVFSRSTACMRDGLLEVMGDRIAGGEVEVRWVKVSVWSSYLETSDDPPVGIERFLGILKRYSESKSPDEFSMILDANYITSISPGYSPKSSLFDLIDLAKVTSLDLQIYLYDDDDEAQYYDSEEEGNEDAPGESGHVFLESSAARQITDLTNLLAKTVNLRIIKLSTDSEGQPYNPPAIGYMLPLLNKFQNAFSGLRRLEWVYLRGMMFHPSFFLIPPQKVKTLKIKSEVSTAWWRKFAKATLENVKELTIFNTAGEIGSWAGEDDDDDFESGVVDKWGGQISGKPKEFEIGSVEVTGLRSFWLQGGFAPRDLGECIIRASKGPVEVLGDFENTL